ncbi:MAG: hypothetical protein V1647_03220 [Pseudomonadota bacterium]
MRKLLLTLILISLSATTRPVQGKEPPKGFSFKIDYAQSTTQIDNIDIYSPDGKLYAWIGFLFERTQPQAGNYKDILTRVFITRQNGKHEEIKVNVEDRYTYEFKKMNGVSGWTVNISLDYTTKKHQTKLTSKYVEKVYVDGDKLVYGIAYNDHGIKASSYEEILSERNDYELKTLKKYDPNGKAIAIVIVKRVYSPAAKNYQNRKPWTLQEAYTHSREDGEELYRLKRLDDGRYEYSSNGKTAQIEVDEAKEFAEIIIASDIDWILYIVNSYATKKLNVIFAWLAPQADGFIIPKRSSELESDTWTKAEAERWNEYFSSQGLMPKKDRTDQETIDLLLRQKGGLLKAFIKYKLSSTDVVASGLLVMPELNESDMTLLNQIVREFDIKVYSGEIVKEQRTRALKKLEDYKRSDKLDISMFYEPNTGPLYMQALIEDAENTENADDKAEKIDGLILLKAALFSPKNLGMMDLWVANLALRVLRYGSMVDELSAKFENEVSREKFNCEGLKRKALEEMKRRESIRSSERAF